MRVDRSYVVFECGCHPPASVAAPEREGERHSISWFKSGQEMEETHFLVARDGKWEMLE